MSGVLTGLCLYIITLDGYHRVIFTLDDRITRFLNALKLVLTPIMKPGSTHSC